MSIAATDVVARAPQGRRGVWFSVKPDTARLPTIGQQVADGSLRSVIAKVVAFEDLAEAIERNRTGHAPGKPLQTSPADFWPAAGTRHFLH